MCWFKKKKELKLYKIVWKYNSNHGAAYTEIVKACDIADAWSQLSKGHGIPISLESWEEVR